MSVWSEICHNARTSTTRVGLDVSSIRIRLGGREYVSLYFIKFFYFIFIFLCVCSIDVGSACIVSICIYI